MAFHTIAKLASMVKVFYSVIVTWIQESILGITGFFQSHLTMWLPWNSWWLCLSFCSFAPAWARSPVWLRLSKTERIVIAWEVSWRCKHVMCIATFRMGGCCIGLTLFSNSHLIGRIVVWEWSRPYCLPVHAALLCLVKSQCNSK